MLFLSGCSKSSASSTGSGAAEQQKVELNGVGSVLKSFETRSELFDVDVLNTDNRHNEKNVSASCYTSGFLSWVDEPFGSRDETTIRGSTIGDEAYKLSININSESGTVMWNGDVTTSFLYHIGTRAWSMSSVMKENGQDREYKYCTPNSVVETLLASLQCFLDNNAQGSEAETVRALLASLNGQREKLASASYPLFVPSKDQDCDKPVDPALFKRDVPVPTGF